MSKAGITLQSLITPKGLVERAFLGQHSLRIKPRSKKRPDIDTALKAVCLQIEQELTDAVYYAVQGKLQKEYAEFVESYGEWATCKTFKEREEWENMADEMVEESIKAWVPALSQDWLGRMTIGSGLHIPNGVEEFSRSLGKEVYKFLVYGRTPAQVMSNAGIMRPEVDKYLEKHLNPTKEEIAMTEQVQNEEFNALVAKVAARLGKDPDNIMVVYDDIDLGSDDDDGLAYGAAARLGITKDEVEVLRMERLVHGSDLPDVFLKAMEAFHEGGKKPKAEKADKAPKAPKAPKVGKKAQKATETASGDVDANEGTIPSSVLITLKDCGVKDEEMGKRLGVSRATYNGYANGKVVLEPDENQLSIVRGAIVDKANALLEALALLDGNEPHVVF